MAGGRHTGFVVADFHTDFEQVVADRAVFGWADIAHKEAEQVVVDRVGFGWVDIVHKVVDYNIVAGIVNIVGALHKKAVA